VESIISVINTLATPFSPDCPALHCLLLSSSTYSCVLAMGDPIDTLPVGSLVKR
jgi:hypothetical protein